MQRDLRAHHTAVTAAYLNTSNTARILAGYLREEIIDVADMGVLLVESPPLHAARTILEPMVSTIVRILCFIWLLQVH